ncbi:uncharacterized protein JN550_009220 [Neoarthrinium moseri]|uniref:uncharacterized protein n=1 Tax=Neoarthrinium moseri TaxID=1658444 RepID=UPI001FDC56E3|nr:uncharacterized protein JN550_009220 [Neoarthrinium moseri]KAI1863941.1 hypothetical protein JN550_009220 [Neoarthrinium moseri]
MPPPLHPRQDGDIAPVPFHEPLAGTVVDVIVSLISIAILSSFLTQRFHMIKTWKKLPLVVWLVFAIFVDSWLFVFVTAILKHGVGINTSYGMCSSAILLCLICYVTTKMIYLFLVEKAFIVRNGSKPRLQSKLYIFNSFGMLTIYVVVSILNFIFRITRIDDGQCIIGMKRVAMIPLITFDLLVNVYLTTLFLIPLRCLYSFRDMPRTRANVRLRSVALRTFVGALSTTISSVVNLTVLMALDGEPGWVCLMCCNCDILFSAVVIQWVTSRDNAGTASSVDHKNSLQPNLDDRGTPQSHRQDGRRASAVADMHGSRSGSKYADEMDVTAYPLSSPLDPYRSAELRNANPFNESSRPKRMRRLSSTSLVEEPPSRASEQETATDPETETDTDGIRVSIAWGRENAQKQMT